MVDLDFGIRSEDAEAAEFVARALAPFRAEGTPATWYSISAQNDRREVQLDGQQILSPRRQHVVPVLLWHLNQRVMLETESYVTVHAAVAGIGGSAVIIPGEADAGKSTLVAALVLAGFDYLSDEAALLDLGAAQVAPYRRWMSLEAGSWPLLPSLRPAPSAAYDQRDQWVLPADDLPGSTAPGVHRPAAILFPKIAPGTPAELRPISRSSAVRRMARHATNLGALGAPGFEAIVHVVEASSCWELALDGVEAAVGQISTLVT